MFMTIWKEKAFDTISVYIIIKLDSFRELDILKNF